MKVAARWMFLTLSATLIVIGFTAHHASWVARMGLFLFLILWLIVLFRDRDDRSLRAAKAGSTRVETVKQTWVGQTVKRYADAGWQAVAQSSAKSFGSQARVTITFRKS